MKDTKARKNKQRTVINKILRRAGKTYKSNIRYTKMIDGKQYCTDGYRLFAFAIPCEEAPTLGENDSSEISAFPYRKFVDGAIADHGKELQLPDVKELKQYIKNFKLVKKNRKSALGCRDQAMYFFGENLPCVNAAYLLDILEAMPAVKLYAGSKCNNALYGVDDLGNETVLMPVRAPEAENTTDLHEHDEIAAEILADESVTAEDLEEIARSEEAEKTEETESAEPEEIEMPVSENFRKDTAATLRNTINIKPFIQLKIKESCPDERTESESIRPIGKSTRFSADKPPPGDGKPRS